MQWIRAPPTLACRTVRRLKLSGKRRMVIAKLCVPRDPYGGDTQVSAWSRALTTACMVTFTIEKSLNSYRRFAKNKVQKAPARRISRLYVSVLVSVPLA